MGNHAAEDNRDDMPVFIHSELDDLGLTPFEFRAYAHLARRVNDRGGTYWESIEAGAEVCQMGTKTYRAALVGLVERGLISREDRPGQTSVYRLEPKAKWRTPAVSGRGKNVQATPAVSGRAGKSGRGTPAVSGRTPLPDQVDKGTPLKVLPEKVLPLQHPTPPTEPPEDEAVGDLTINQQADYRLGSSRKPTLSHLTTFHKPAFLALVDFRRVHPKPVNDAQFEMWSRSVLEDCRAFGQDVVVRALVATIDRAATLDAPFVYYRKVVRGLAQPPRTASAQAPPDEFDAMFAAAKEGSL